jgi:hypothetical protein
MLDVIHKSCEPSAWCLTDAVESSRQEAHVVGSLWILESGWLLAEDAFHDVAVEERVGDVELMRWPVLGGNEGEHGADRSWLDYWRERLGKVVLLP